MAIFAIDDHGLDLSRLWVGSHNRNNSAWTVVLILGFLSHLAIALVHLDKPRAGALALGLFGVATTTSYWLLTYSANPFRALHTNMDAAGVWRLVQSGI